MRRPVLAPALAAAVLLAPLLGFTAPAAADHTDPKTTLSPVLPQTGAGALTAGEGEWEHLGNVGPMQGTDLEPFTKGRTTYVAGGTLGQGPSFAPGFVGQRVVQLTDDKGEVVAPKVVADHGSARCNQPATGVTGLQHDVQAVPKKETELLVDTVDAVGRCHDTPGGGLEILDVTGLGQPGFEVRELALVRLNGLSHTVTADATRPGILYNNQADFAGTTWIDIVDVRSCLGLAGKSLQDKRAACKPVVTRLDYADTLSSKRLPDGRLAEPASCHDITAAPDRLYCAGLNASFVLDVSGVFNGGKVNGTPLPCTLVDGTATGAKVTDCALKAPGSTSANPSAADAIAAYEALGKPGATGAQVVSVVNHPGRACGNETTVTCNTNTQVRSDQGVAVSHEADPTPDGRFMLVTDERGGGVVPPGSTCSPGLDNPVGNGGLHVFDITKGEAVYAKNAEGGKAVYIGTSPTPSPTFCTIHVIEQVPGEARIVAAYYDGGTKIVDYEVDDQGRWTFEEVASYRLPGANTWASEVFDTRENEDGTTTYFFVSNSFALGEGTARGLDVFSWTGPANPLAKGAAKDAKDKDDKGKDKGDSAAGGSGGGGGSDLRPVAAQLPATGPDQALLLLALVALPLAAGTRVLRARA